MYFDEKKVKHFHFCLKVYFKQLNIPVVKQQVPKGFRRYGVDIHFVSMYIFDLGYDLNLGGHICEVLPETYQGISRY